MQTTDTSKAGAGKFSCAACGRQFSWKPQLAGKKAKCACGSTVVVPREAPGAPAPTTIEDAYDFASAPEAAPATWASDPRAPEPSTAAPNWGAKGKVLVTVGPTEEEGPDPREERRRRRAEAPLSKGRDVVAPIVLAALGVSGIVAWAASPAAPGGSFNGGLAVGFAIAVKTAIMAGLALITAPAMRVNYPDPRVAGLKFGGVLLFADAALLWLDAALHPGGGAEPSSSQLARLLVFELLAAAVVVGVLAKFLFDLDVREALIFAAPLSALSHVLGFMLRLILGAIVVAVVAAAAEEAAYEEEAGDDVPAAVAPSSAPSVAPASTAPPAVLPEDAEEAAEDDAEDGGLFDQFVEIKNTTQDREILRRVRAGVVVREAQSWLDSQPDADPVRMQLVQAFYAAAAKKVYFDFSDGRLSAPTKAYVELSRWRGERERCFKVYEKYKPAGAAVKDQDQRFLVVALPK